MGDFIWVDILIVCIFLISIVIGIIRGFISESISVASWIIAAWLAIVFTPSLSDLITFTKIESMRDFIAFLIIFTCIVFLGAILNYIVHKIVRKTPFSIPDRVLGVLFGVIRGGVVVTLLVLLGGLTPFTKDAWWQESYTLDKFQVIAIWLKDRFPPEMAENFKFHTKETQALEDQG